MLGQADFSGVLRYVRIQQTSAQQSVPVGASQTQSTPVQVSKPIDRSGVEAAVKAFIQQQPIPKVAAVDPQTNRIDADVDRSLLYHVFTELGHGRLSEAEKVYARQVYRSEV
jgi:hypothetical protein